MCIRDRIETCQGDPETLANTIAEELEQMYSDDILKAIVKNKGLKIDQT